jgi:hypothetical protein
MTVYYGKWIGGASSGSALTVGTAWDMTYATALAARFGPGDELRVCDTSQYTMTFANRLMVKCGSGTPSNKVRIVGADSSGNPFRGLGRPIPVLAGDNRATWGTNAAVSPAMLTIDSVNGAGAGSPIQHWEIEDLIFDGVDGKPYTGIANQGAANAVYNNHSGTVRNCDFLNIFHNVVSLSGCSDQAGLVAIPKANTLEGCLFTVATGGTPQGVLIPRVGPTARSGYLARNCVFDGKGTTVPALLLTAMTSESLFDGCALLNCGTGVRFPTSRTTNTAVRRTFIDSMSTAGADMVGIADIVEDCLITRCNVGFLVAGESLPQDLRIRNTNVVSPTLAYFSNDSVTAELALNYRALGANPIMPPRNRSF